MDLFDLTGRTAIVTGASSGLGVTFAEALAAHGAAVVIAARREERLAEVADRITRSGAEVLAVRCDVAEEGQVEALVRAAVDRFGRLDVMVNNAGVLDAGPRPERQPSAMFEQAVRVNLLGVWYGCQHAGRVMLRRGSGSIINVSSAAGLVAACNFPPAYQATKAAILHLARNLAVSWAERGVRVNSLAPGWFPSEMTDPFISAPVIGDRLVRGMIPMGRVGRPEELVGPLLFLASDASSYVTGATLVADGGIAAMVGPRYDAELDAVHAQIVPGELGLPITPEVALAT